MTPADVCFGRHHDILSRRERTKRRTLAQRTIENLRTGVIELENRLFDNQRCCAKASDDAQFKTIPIAMREELDRRQILFLPDIFDLISEYA